MVYSIKYKTGVYKDLRKLPKSVAAKAMDAVEDILSKNPYLGIALKGGYQGLHRYRIGDYRIVYFIDDKKREVLILRIRHRKDVY